MFDSWWLDAKLGLRMLAKYPGLTLCGGAGIAVAVAIAAGGFSVIYGNLLASSLPLPEGDRVVALLLEDSARQKQEPRLLYEFHHWRATLRSVEEISAYRSLTPNLITLGAPPEGIRVAAITASGLRLARVRPLLGRSIEESDERSGAAPVVMIGEDVWRSRYAADPSILNRRLQLGSTPHAVVGVMPKGFAFPLNHQYWVALPVGVAPSEPLSGPPLTVFARLAPGATVESARAEVTAAGQRTAQAFPQTYGKLRPQVTSYVRAALRLPGEEDFAGVLAMQGLVISLLVLVCLNVAILVYTRTAVRQAEIGLRTALGAGRGRIVGQLFVEALVLAVLAAATGVGLAWLALRQLTAATGHLAGELPFWLVFELVPEAGLYAAALSILAAAICGIVPAWQATRGLSGAGKPVLRLGGTWTALIVAQVAFAVALLPPAAVNAWRDLQAALAGPGFPASEFLAAQVGGESATAVPELLRRLEAEPLAGAVTFARVQPGEEPSARLETESGSVHEVRTNGVAVNYFATFAVPLRAGRRFVAGDAALGGAVLVNQPLAARLFAGQALGKRLRYAGDATGRWYEIAGVVADFPTGVSANMLDSELKLYHAIAPSEARPAAVAVRVRGGAASAFGPRLRELAGAVDPEMPVRDVQNLEDVLRREQWIRRLEAGIILAVTFSVLLLSAAGIYALMSFTVSQRHREIGIRMALGASRGSLLRGVFARALRQLAAGAALGALVTALADRSSEGALMQGHAVPVTVAVTLVMLAMGLAAATGPARRSLRVEPAVALREH